MGGQANFVKDKLSRSLARHGISIHTHWSWDKAKAPVKLPDVDLVYICTDMVAHKVSVPCMEMARSLDIPYVNGTRKWAESIERLTAAGFPLHNPQENLPLILDESLPKQPKDRLRPPTESELRGVMIAMSGTTDMSQAPAVIADQLMPSVSTLAATMNAPVPQSQPLIQETALMNDTRNYRDRSKTQGLDNRLQQAYLHALIIEPTLSNDQLWERIQSHPFLAGKKFDAQRGATARVQLGISVERKGGERRVNVEIAKFCESARKIGLKNFTVPQSLYVEVDPHQLSSPARLNAARVIPEPAPQPAAATPAKRLDGMDELKDLLTLVRVKMAEESITELHLTADGVKFKQVKVVEGELAV